MVPVDRFEPHRGLAASQAFLKAIDPAILKAISEEIDRVILARQYNVTLKSWTGKPPSHPLRIDSWIPLSTAG